MYNTASHFRHKHPTPTDKVENLALNHNLKQAALLHPHYSPRECERFMHDHDLKPNLDRKLRYSKIRSVVYRTQGEVRPVNVKTLVELDEALRNNPGYIKYKLDMARNPFYDGLLTDEKGNRAMAFVSRRVLKKLKNMPLKSAMNLQIFVDGTFQTLPK